jgi:hypothetical protein
MKPDVDDMTGAERPRRRLLVSVVAVLLPVVVLAGASAWFIRSYVLPPMITIEPIVAASADAMPKDPPQPAIPPETTGASPAAAAVGWSAPTVRYTTNSAEIWAAVPLPGPPRQVQSPAAAPVVASIEPSAAPVPLPPRRPRLSTADFDLPAVPLPRPRPAFASN